MLEPLLLKREQFPLDIKDSNGELLSNSSRIIPFLHPDFIENGIDLALIDETICEEIEYMTNKDREECVSRSYLNYEDRIIKLGRIERGEDYVKFPQFNQGLCIQKKQIVPFGPLLSDGGIIVKTEPIPLDYKDYNCGFSNELIEEYKGERYDSDYVSFNKGWRSHNLDCRDIIIKNTVIALNNANVRKKYQR